ncbi:MAG TPA: VOC family protein, partial [Actinomycetota bacterium]|nr:VOC family protein [Actinomycetota bacterium]
AGSPGSILTFFEYPGASRGRHGAGMIHTIQWGVDGQQALDFWEERLTGEGFEAARLEDRLRLEDPEGLGIELVADPEGEPALPADWHEIPAEFALKGFAGVRVYDRVPSRREQQLEAAGHRILDSHTVLTETLGFEPVAGAPDAYRLTQGVRRATYLYEQAPAGRGFQGGGSVHHIAWACSREDQESWRQRIIDGHLSPTPIIDRQYFYSIYFREPSGVLFEIATIGPGFAIDEPLEQLGESLQLPPQHEHMRHLLEERLTPLTNPRTSRPAVREAP